MTAARVVVGGAAPYPVHVGPGALARVAGAVPDGERRALLADAAAHELHGGRLAGLGDARLVPIGTGEGAKTLGALERVLEEVAAAGLDRRSWIVVLGGGVACDLGGLAAALYMRGVAHVLCPTTLLAQVDAAVGGKTAVDLRAGRNLAGAIHPPRAVFADTDVLATLGEDELRSGLGEAVKTALVDPAAEGRALELLEEEAEAYLARDAAALARLVERCVRAKAAFVAADERDEGPRHALNLGHTFAHAIELAAGPGRIPHGVAVAAGLGLALRASRSLGVLEDAELPERVARILARLGLPAGLDDLRVRAGAELGAAELVGAMRHDKKGRAGAPALVLVRRAGAVVRDVEIPAPELVALLR